VGRARNQKREKKGQNEKNRAAECTTLVKLGKAKWASSGKKEGESRLGGKDGGEASTRRGGETERGARLVETSYARKTNAPERRSEPLGTKKTQP